MVARSVIGCSVTLVLAVSFARGGAPASGLPQGQSALQPDGLTAFRPQHGAGYAPFRRTRVPEALEESAELGPGIRRNGPGETDPSGEDDLIEIIVGRVLANANFVLERSGPELELWSTRDKQPGSAIPFVGNRSPPLSFGREREITLWVEWVGASHGLAVLELTTPQPGPPADRLLFHSFHALIAALGGEGQTPGLPLDPNHGTFVIGTELYGQGYDVHMHDEDGVAASGSGPVYDEIVNAVQRRGVEQLAIFGYSHGGGSTHDLSERLDANRPGIGAFSIEFTSYVDGIENDSDVDVDMELRRPPSTAYHANHYQHGTFADFFLDGGPVPISEPPPSGLDAETTAWGMGATHFVVDDFAQVLGFISSNLDSRLNR